MSLSLLINSNNVIQNGTNSQFQYKFISGGINIPEGSEICIGNATIPYSFFNINQELYNNATFQYTFPSATGQTTYTITLQNGFYTVDDINNILQTYFVQNNQYLVNSTGSNLYFMTMLYDTVYYSVQTVYYVVPSSLPAGYTNPGMTFPNVPTTPQLIINNNNFGAIIGYLPGSYPTIPMNVNQSLLSNTIPNGAPVNSIVFRCNLCNNNAVLPSDILDSMSINGAFGTNLNYQPYFSKWLKVKPGKYANLMLTMVDQNLNAIVANDNAVSITLLLKIGNTSVSK